jgi:hypothetical protein
MSFSRAKFHATRSIVKSLADIRLICPGYVICSRHCRNKPGKVSLQVAGIAGARHHARIVEQGQMKRLRRLASSKLNSPKARFMRAIASIRLASQTMTSASSES